jgi:hypothetical protein
MERRYSLRARTDVEVIARAGLLTAHFRGIDLSPLGILVDQGSAGPRLEDHVLVDLELRLPERIRPLHAVARPVWSSGSQQALLFVHISDVDRLTLAEHMDMRGLEGIPMH